MTSREKSAHAGGGVPPPGPSFEGMVQVPGGPFMMGSDAFYPEERPAHRVIVAGLWMDAHPVTNAEFRRFVEATGHVTVAERRPDPADYPGAHPALLVPGSLVFQRPTHPVGLTDFRLWWAYVPGASWHQPEGPGSALDGRDRHPVVHVAYEDAAAYAAWAGKALPTEAEWEYAARGGLDAAAYVWGDEFAPDGRLLANTWQGEFPWQNLAADGFEGTSPVGTFPANGYGLFDMAGNVWEWTCDLYRASHGFETAAACCVSPDPRSRPAVAHSSAGRARIDNIRRKVLKGGSHLCAPNYCLRYRPAARQGEAIDTSACHVGFRCVVRT
jgi:formylglycine-generating enzyme required for sulfatase activity